MTVLGGKIIKYSYTQMHLYDITWVLSVFLTGIGADTEYFADFAPWGTEYLIPYALDICQPGPKKGTFATYFCDDHSAGVWRYVSFELCIQNVFVIF